MSAASLVRHGDTVDRCRHERSGTAGRPRRFTRFGVVVLIVLSALALVACGDDDTSDASVVPDGSDIPATPGPTTGEGAEDPGGTGDPGLPDACGLLSAADLQAATGLPFGEGVPNEAMSTDDRLVCDWRVDDPYATAQVLVVADGAESFDAQRSGVEDMMDEETVATDLGDEGYRTSEGSIYAMRVGSLFVQVSFIPPDNTDVVAETEQLARTVLGRLG